jgi:enterochelin esterase-like enzyme
MLSLMVRWFIGLFFLLAVTGCTSTAASRPIAAGKPTPTGSAVVAVNPTAIAAPGRETDRLNSPAVECQKASCQGASRRLDVWVPSQTLGQDVPVRIFVPPCDPCNSAGLPVIYLLHGASADESQWDDVAADEAADAGRIKGLLPPLILVFPKRIDDSAQPRPDGDLPFEHFVVSELIPWVEAHTPARPDRADRAIGGISRGGFWALEITFRHPELFGAVGGHSPVAGRKDDPYSPLGLVAAHPAELRSLRVWLDVGADDGLKAGVANLAADLTAAEIPTTFEQWPGGHNRPYWRSHTADYLAFYTALWSQSDKR